MCESNKMVIKYSKDGNMVYVTEKIGNVMAGKKIILR